jgi:hypothetical protein
MKRNVLLILIFYIFPNILTSCIDCGGPSKNYLKDMTSLTVVEFNSIEETFQNRIETSSGEEILAKYFALKLELEMTDKRNIAFKSAGYNCFACSLVPPFLASQISNVNIQFSQEFEGAPSGANLKDLFVVDPMSNYYPPFHFLSIEKFELASNERPAEEINFVFKEELKRNYEGTFIVSLISEGKEFKKSTELVKIISKN